jgi:magnesium transporter
VIPDEAASPRLSAPDRRRSPGAEAPPPVLGHRLEAAAQHLVRNVPLAQPEELVKAVLARLLGGSFEAVELVCITDVAGRLCGTLTLTEILSASGHQPVGELMQRDLPTVKLDDDQEHVAGIAVRHGITAVPVVDGDGHLEGVVPARALMAILRHEHVEDLHRLAGIQRETAHARQAIEAPPARRVHDRLPWLLAGLAGSMLATFVVSRFEQTLASRIAVSFFVPGIVYLADAIGTQTEAIAVRGLSLSHVPFRRLLAGELWTGALIGVCLGGLAAPFIVLAYQDVRLALAVGTAVACAGAVATGIGLLLPWALSNRGKDPAFGSGPVATIIQDVLSLLIYFTIAQLLIR